MTAPATTVRCTTTPVNAAMPSTSAPRERENDRAHSTPMNIQLTPKSLDVQAFTAIDVTGSTRDSHACALLLRPDCYVDWATDTARPGEALRESLRVAFVSWFGAPRPDRRN